MNIVTLTQSTGILRPFAIVLGYIMNYIYRFLQIFGINNVALTIILFTLVVNILLTPLSIRQQKFTKMSAVINPELKKIQKKYDGKKDERSMRMQQAETQALYDKYGASPTSGCLPLLIQMPILFALYRVIYNIPAYVEPVREIYMKIAEPIFNTSGAGSIMENLISDMSLAIRNFDITDINKIIDALNLVKSNGWETVSKAFSAAPEVTQAITQYSGEIVKMNSFIGGLNIANTPVDVTGGMAGIFPGILIPILAGVSQYINIKISQKNTATDNSEMGSTMKTMNLMMPLISVFFCWSLPVGIGIYWIASAVFRTISYVLIDKFFTVGDLDAIVEANKEKAAKKAEKRDAATKKQLEAYANMNTKKKSISELAAQAGGREDSGAPDSKKKAYQQNSSQAGKKSVAGYAHMVGRKDDK